MRVTQPDMRSTSTITCMRTATTCIGTRTVTAPMRTGMPRSTPRWRDSTAVGSAGSRSMTGYDRLRSALFTASQDRPPSH